MSSCVNASSILSIGCISQPSLLQWGLSFNDSNDLKKLTQLSRNCSPNVCSASDTPSSYVRSWVNLIGASDSTQIIQWNKYQSVHTLGYNPLITHLAARCKQRHRLLYSTAVNRQYSRNTWLVFQIIWSSIHEVQCLMHSPQPAWPTHTPHQCDVTTLLPT